MKLSKPDRVVLSATACVSIAFVFAGRLNTATAVLLAPLLMRGGVVMLDVFWTSFTGMPLLRARKSLEQGIRRADAEADLKDEDAEAGAGGARSPLQPAQLGPFGRLSILPSPLRAPKPRRVALFDDRSVRPGPPSQRLRARKARLGFF